MSKKQNNKNELSEDVRDTIIDEAVKQYKDRKRTNNSYWF